MKLLAQFLPTARNSEAVVLTPHGIEIAKQF
jgi:NAD(P)H-hydrate repair Nnr-like enzyme with NAD(P)H-hydrate dehydratase domain